MTEYIRVDYRHVSQESWLAYIPTYGIFVESTSRADLLAEIHQVLEREFGLKSFGIVWGQC